MNDFTHANILVNMRVEAKVVAPMTEGLKSDATWSQTPLRMKLRDFPDERLMNCE